MLIYDISREVFQAKVYPGDPIPEFERVKKISKGDICNLSMIKTCAHNATHVDAPFHFYENGKTTEEIELQKCVGVEGFTVGTEETSCDVHRVLLAKEIVIVEALDLSKVSSGKYFLVSAPVKYGHLDGAPCRAMLFGQDKEG